MDRSLVRAILRAGRYRAVLRRWAFRPYEYARTHHEEFVGQSAAAVQAEIDRLEARKAAAE